MIDFAVRNIAIRGHNILRDLGYSILAPFFHGGVAVYILALTDPPRG